MAPKRQQLYEYECPFCLRSIGDPSERFVDRWIIRHLTNHVRKLEKQLDDRIRRDDQL